MFVELIDRLRATEGVEKMVPVDNGAIAIYVETQDGVPAVLAEIASTMLEYGYDEDFQITTNKKDLVVYIDLLENDHEEEYDEETDEEE